MLETLLQRLPSSAGTAGNQSSSYWTSNGYGTTQVNLRGLGIDRTLVLLNGRRVVAGGTGANSSRCLTNIAMPGARSRCRSSWSTLPRYADHIRWTLG